MKRYVAKRITPHIVRNDVMALLLTEREFRNRYQRSIELIVAYGLHSFGRKFIKITVGSCQAPFWRWVEWSNRNKRSLFFSIIHLESNYRLCEEIVNEIDPRSEKDLLFGYNGYPNRYYRSTFRKIYKALQVKKKEPVRKRLSLEEGTTKANSNARSKSTSPISVVLGLDRRQAKRRRRLRGSTAKRLTCSDRDRGRSSPD